MKFEIYKVSSGTYKDQWRWRLKASNVEPIASGESYHNKSDVLHVIKLIKDGAADAPTVEVSE